MIRQLIFQLIKKHGLLFILEIIREFMVEYRQRSVMDEIKRQNENSDNVSDTSDFVSELINKFKR